MVSVKGKKSAGEYFAKLLNAYGVTYVFNIENILRITIREMEQLGIKTIMPHSENAAGYMADGYARISGKPGVCFAQSIGSANLAAGIHDAWLACSPVIAVTGKKPIEMQYRNSYQESDHRPMFDSVTKFNADVYEPSQLPFLLRQCFREAVTGKPRPVHLDVLSHTGRSLEEAPLEEPFRFDAQYGQYPAIRCVAPEEDIVRAACEINRSKQPVLIAGRGAVISGAGEEFASIARGGSIPFVTTPDAKALVNEDHPLWRGIVGDYGMDSANRTVSEADLVIFVGSQVNDQTTINWSIPKAGVKIVQIDVDGAELGKNYAGCIGLCGDAREILRQLGGHIEKSVSRKEWLSKTAMFLKQTLEEYGNLAGMPSKAIRPEALCADLSELLPERAVLVSDTGYSAVWTSGFLRMKSSQRYIRAAGSMGWAFPASLGVKCAAPDRPVICFTGDGGFYYHLSEMETAVRYGIKTVTIVNNNQILAQCANDISKVFGSYEKGSRHFTFSDICLGDLASNMGALGMRVTKREEFAGAFNTALQSDKPAIIEVMTERVTTVPASFKG